MKLSKLKQILSENNLTTRKSLDQHFLYDKSILQREVEYAGVTELDNILEIGPGIGTLTEKILEKSENVTVIELDSRFRKILEKLNIQIVIANALKVDWEKLFVEYETPKFNKIISNVPYSISSPLIFKILKYGPELAVLCLQKEFAQRMVAQAGTSDYSRLSVNCAVRADVELLEEIPKEEYYPIPRVDSAIVRITPKKRGAGAPGRRGGVVLPEKFDSVVRAAFQHKRQKLKKAIMHSWKELGTKEEAQAFVDTLGVIGEKKVFEISADEFIRITT
ncbi:MAG: 16S rRNA (adenine(1518)-N(6)/adenine(1519)-N(6))-dimethyltransferase RsmA [Candidatus Undinarchaeales archaeon]|jgi:16S rRNA (adenine1518-N6/adenine1519-N6)-dimethyltransferase|nr:16S rRNA (adenine(1518)-N(6)/adenine(1519)-N(6))-dimethyltransferase RsmA [Candidatus Undinarchaeales archaeon]